MKTWLSASELAALGLPALPGTKRSMVRVAARGGWQSRPRAGRGGGLEYALESLPAEARAAYVARHVEPIAIPEMVSREAAAEPAAAGLPAGGAQARDARLALLAQVDRYRAAAALTQKAADRHFCDQYNLGALDIADWIRAEVKALSPRSLKRWRRHARSGNKSKLAVDRGASRRDTGVLARANDGAVKTYILAAVVKQPQLTAHHIRALVADKFPALTVKGKLVDVPPVRTFQHALKAWRHEFRVEIESIRNPDGFKSTMRFAARVAMPASRVNELWQIDASPADVLTIDGRYSLYLCEDIFSRRLVGLVTKTPRAAAVGLLVRKAIIAWGVPERIKTDNGSDFVARETQRLFAALAIEHEKAPPFSPEKKGHIERAIGTLQRGLMRTLEGFVGHSVADRKVIENRKAFAARLGEAPEDMFQVALSAADLQGHVDSWCADVYGNAPHAGLGGRTPFAAAATCAEQPRRIEDPRALDMLLAPVAGKDGLRTVTKTGLRIGGAYYIGGFLNVGDSVMVRMDPADMGRAYVFSDDGLTFRGEALCPDLAGIDPAAAIAAARAEQKRLINDRMESVRREARKIKASDMAPAIHRQALAAAGKLIEFPKQAAPHDTPALAAAREAANEDGAVAGHAPEIAALAARMREEEATAANVAPLRTEETAHQRWNRARALEDALANGRDVPADELLWLGSYRTSPEYRGFALTYGVDVADGRSPAAAGHHSAT